MASRVDVVPGGLANSVHRTRIEPGKAYRTKNCNVDQQIWQADWGYDLIAARDDTVTDDDGLGLTYGEYAADSYFLLRSTHFTPADPSYAGKFSFIFTYNGRSVQTAAIAYNASAQEIATALVDLPPIDVADVDVIGGSHPGTTTEIRFIGKYSGKSVSLAFVNSLGTYADYFQFDQLVTGGEYKTLLYVVKPNGTSNAARVYAVERGSDAWDVGTFVADNQPDSPYLFQAYDDKIYLASYKSGMLRYRFGGAITDPVNGLPTPGRMSSPDYISRVAGYLDTFDASQWAVSVGGNLSTLGCTASISNGQIRITAGSASTSAGFGWVELSSGVDVQFQFADVWNIKTTAAVASTSNFQVALNFIRLFSDDGTEIRPKEGNFWQDNSITIGYQSGRWCNFTHESLLDEVPDKSRLPRKTTRKIRLYFAWSGMTAAEVFTITLESYGTWPNDTKSLLLAATDRSRDRSPIPDTESAPLYALAYADDSGQEGPLSTPFRVANPGIIPVEGTAYQFDLHRLIPKYPFNRASLIYVYRRDVRGNWRRLPNSDLTTYGIDNDGVTDFIDRFMFDEIEDFPIYRQGYGVGLYNLGRQVEALSVWRGSLCVGARRKIYISGVGLPEEFHGDPDTPGDQWGEREDAGRVDYVSSNRSESPLDIKGKDSLYITTGRGVWTITGGLPSIASLVRELPDTKGSLGMRSSASYDGGILVGTSPGLYYYSIGRTVNVNTDTGAMPKPQELTAGVRESWQRLIGDDSSIWPQTVVRIHEGEVWCFCQNRYLRLTRNDSWIEGEYPIEVRDAVSVAGYGLLFQGEDGRVYRLHSGATDFAGTDIDWYWLSGDLIGPRARVVGIASYSEGRPTVTLTPHDGAAGEFTDTFTLNANYNEVNTKPVVAHFGFRQRVKVAGSTSSDKVISLAFETDGGAPGKGS